MKKHIKDIHVKFIRKECTVCGKGFTKNHELEAHLRTHNEIQPFICDLCDNQFYSKMRLKKHISGHNTNKFCHYYNNQKFCPYAFVSNNKHLRKVIFILITWEGTNLTQNAGVDISYELMFVIMMISRAANKCSIWVKLLLLL